MTRNSEVIGELIARVCFVICLLVALWSFVWLVEVAIDYAL